MKRILSILCISVALAGSGCARYVVHPGSINVADSKTYDVLLGAKAIIDTARVQFASGALDARFKPAMNKIVDAYNAAFPVYRSYHMTIDSGDLPPESQRVKLNALVAALNTAISEFKAAK